MSTKVLKFKFRKNAAYGLGGEEYLESENIYRVYLDVTNKVKNNPYYFIWTLDDDVNIRLFKSDEFDAYFKAYLKDMYTYITSVKKLDLAFKDRTYYAIILKNKRSINHVSNIILDVFFDVQINGDLLSFVHEEHRDLIYEYLQSKLSLKN